jgi:hypothetical protein
MKRLSADEVKAVCHNESRLCQALKYKTRSAFSRTGFFMLEIRCRISVDNIPRLSRYFTGRETIEYLIEKLSAQKNHAHPTS